MAFSAVMLLKCFSSRVARGSDGESASMAAHRKIHHAEFRGEGGLECRRTGRDGSDPGAPHRWAAENEPHHHHCHRSSAAPRKRASSRPGASLLPLPRFHGGSLPRLLNYQSSYGRVNVLAPDVTPPPWSRCGDGGPQHAGVCPAARCPAPHRVREYEAVEPRAPHLALLGRQVSAPRLMAACRPPHRASPSSRENSTSSSPTFERFSDST